MNKDAAYMSTRGRKTADFIFRYMSKTHSMVTEARQPRTNLHCLALQALAEQTHRSIGLMCDASPKAKMDATRPQDWTLLYFRFLHMRLCQSACCA